jgi:TRAP-type C4-dicarboxylate transport system permease small subunit
VPNKHLARNAGTFVKHVLPAAVKPVHSLWHEILGFVFLMFAAVAGWKVFRNSSSLGFVQLSILSVFILVMVVYGVASFLKARRISRS